MGRQPQTGSGGCPTTRVPPNVAPAGNAPPNGPLPPGEVRLPPLNADMMLAWLRQLGRLRLSYRLRSVLCWTWPTRKSRCKVLSRSWKGGSMTNFGCYRRSLISKIPSCKSWPRFQRNMDEALVRLWTRTFRLAVLHLQRRELGRIPRKFRCWMR